MSKMSQLHAELQEEAWDMGYVSLEAAFDDGWEIDYEHRRLYKKLGRISPNELKKMEGELDKAHEAWQEEKDKMLSILKGVQSDIAEWLDNKDHPDIKGLEEVITFMEDYCHD